MSQVVGALLADVVLGPAILKVLHETDFIKQIVEFGVIVLMVIVGLETDLKESKQMGKASFVIALLGVLFPLVGGFWVASFYHEISTAESVSQVLRNIFIVVILTTTSVSIKGVWEVEYKG